MKRMLLVALGLLLGASCTSAQDAKMNQYLNGTIFEDITEQSGFVMGDDAGKSIAMGDYDRDGDLDLYVCTCYTDNKLFLNEGNLRFTDVTRFLHLECGYETFAAVWADFNNDGNLDLFVSNGQEGARSEFQGFFNPNTFYVGGYGGFYECAKDVGLAGQLLNAGMDVAVADVNGDGLLDIYLGKGSPYFGSRQPANFNSLYVNKGDGTYRDIAKDAGVAHEGFSFNCSFSDYDNDGDPDLFVGSIGGPPGAANFVLYRNNGDGTFSDVSKEAGIVLTGRCTSCFWGDIDNDGDQDLFLSRSPDPNVLFRNNGDGTFTDISREAGIAGAQTNTRGCTTGDIDNDGDLDIIVNNSGSDTLIYINDGKGTFGESHETTGGSYWCGHGCVLGDLDNDGDLDFVGGNWRHTWRPKTELGRKWCLFRNKTDNNNFIKVNAIGTKSNRSAVMSKVRVYDAGKAGDRDALRGYREVAAGNNVFCSNPLQQHFGVDASRKYDIVVRFPSGMERTMSNVEAGKTYDVHE